jgi:hypothetical protein
LLARLNAAPDEKHRPAVFLTNALTGWQGPDQLKLNFPELQDQHDAARRHKARRKRDRRSWNSPYNALPAYRCRKKQISSITIRGSPAIASKILNQPRLRAGFVICGIEQRS